MCARADSAFAPVLCCRDSECGASAPPPLGISVSHAVFPAALPGPSGGPGSTFSRLARTAVTPSLQLQTSLSMSDMRPTSGCAPGPQQAVRPTCSWISLPQHLSAPLELHIKKAPCCGILNGASAADPHASRSIAVCESRVTYNMPQDFELPPVVELCALIGEPRSVTLAPACIFINCT